MARKLKTRSDYTQDFRDILAAAIRLRVVDATEIYVYGVNRMSDRKILEDLLVCAFANRHSAAGSAAHGELVGLCDAYIAARQEGGR